MKKKWYKIFCAMLTSVFLVSAPAVTQAAAQSEAQTENAQEETSETDREIPEELAGLKYDHSLELEYADQFAVDYYEGGYALISIVSSGQFLLVPEGKEVPEGLDEDITVIRQPVQNIYLVATSAMDLFCALDGLDSISLSGTNADGWYIDEAKQAMEDGSITFAGKYSAPDYELILSKKCDLAIESTMIYHQPEVQEKLEQFGIPVLVEHSSYESHPLGRTEWIKLYGVLLGKEDQAEKLFQEQVDKLKSVEDSENTGKTVAFFYINSMGAANVRKSNDYVSKMIELAGGEYIFHDPAEDDNALSTMNMQMEEFYAKAKDADYIIYNSTIDGELNSIDELLSKSSLLADFKAVKDGNVWCTGQNLFQETMGLATMIEDIHTMLTSDDPDLDSLTYMKKLK
nr:ABC transporter substrate-binding protein [uncultured Blautia sp.]